MASASALGTPPRAPSTSFFSSSRWARPIASLHIASLRSAGKLPCATRRRQPCRARIWYLRLSELLASVRRWSAAGSSGQEANTRTAVSRVPSSAAFTAARTASRALAPPTWPSRRSRVALASGLAWAMASASLSAQDSLSASRRQTEPSIFSAAPISPGVLACTSRRARAGSSGAAAVSPRACIAAARIEASASAAALSRSALAAVTWRWPRSAMAAPRSFTSPLPARPRMAASTSWPTRLASEALAAWASSPSPWTAVRNKSGTTEASPSRARARRAAARTAASPCSASGSTAASAARSPRSARASTRAACLGGGSLASSAARALVISGPGISRASVSAKANISASVARTWAMSNSVPPAPRARMAPRVAAMRAGLGASALRTRS